MSCGGPPCRFRRTIPRHNQQVGIQTHGPAPLGMAIVRAQLFEGNGQKLLFVNICCRIAAGSASQEMPASQPCRDEKTVLHRNVQNEVLSGLAGVGPELISDAAQNCPMRSDRPDKDGPDRPLKACVDAALQLHQTCRSCVAQQFQETSDGRADKPDVELS